MTATIHLHINHAHVAAVLAERRRRQQFATPEVIQRGRVSLIVDALFSGAKA